MTKLLSTEFFSEMGEKQNNYFFLGLLTMEKMYAKILTY